MSAEFLVDLKLAAEPALLRTARLVVSSLAADRGLGLDDMEDLKLAVQEACASRLARGLAEATVRVRVREEGTSLIIEVLGDRPGKGTDDEEADVGLALAEALVDSMSIDDRNGIERIVLTKAVPGSSR